MKTNGFISYKRSDGSELATVFNNSLEAAGYKLFFDKESLNAGEFIWDIKNGIKDTELVIVILTMDYFRDMGDTENYIRKELDFARQHEKKLFIVTNISDIYDLINSREQEIYKWMSGFNIETYVHGDSQKLIAKMKAAFTNIRAERLDFDESVLQKTKDIIDIEGYKYKGELRFGRPYGEGVLTDEMAQRVYEGEWFGWESPALTGKGNIYNTATGKKIYEGSWQKLKYEWEGTLYSENWTYTGFFKGGSLCGNGTLTFTNGSVFKGISVNDFIYLSSGYGELSRADGSYYMGQIKAVRKNTPQELKDDDLYYEGIGKLMTPDETKYDGEFSEGLIVRGIKIQKNGYIVDGSYRNGKISANKEITIFDSNAKLIFKGALDEKAKISEYHYKNGMVYKGGFFGAVKSGSGVLLNPDGTELFRGEWDYFAPVKNYNTIGGELYMELLADEKSTFKSIENLFDNMKYKAPTIEEEIEVHENKMKAAYSHLDSQSFDPKEMEEFVSLLNELVPDWRSKGAEKYWIDKCCSNLPPAIRPNYDSELAFAIYGLQLMAKMNMLRN